MGGRRIRSHGGDDSDAGPQISAPGGDTVFLWPCDAQDGEAGVAGEMDLDRNPRIVGGEVDIGAYEAQLDPLDAPTVPAGDAGYKKLRYVSFVPGNPGQRTAYRVVLTPAPVRLSVRRITRTGAA